MSHNDPITDIAAVGMSQSEHRAESDYTPKHRRTFGDDGPVYHSRVCMEAWMWPCRCGADEANGVVTPSASEVRDV